MPSRTKAARRNTKAKPLRQSVTVPAALGAGEFDNVSQIRALIKDGYKGAFTLETHWRSPEGKSLPRRVAEGDRPGLSVYPHSRG